LGFFFLAAKLLGPTAASVIHFVLLQEVRAVLITWQEALLINRRLGRYLAASPLIHHHPCRHIIIITITITYG
jgi:hypothetical protein